MERRPFFVLGDLLVNLLVGVAAAAASRGLASPDWHPLVGMIAGMVCGLFVAAPIALAFMPLFGALEVMLSATFTGMIAGMVVGMIHAALGLSPGEAAAFGASLGLLSIGWVYFLTARESSKGGHGSRDRA